LLQNDNLCINKYSSSKKKKIIELFNVLTSKEMQKKKKKKKIIELFNVLTSKEMQKKKK